MTKKPRRIKHVPVQITSWLHTSIVDHVCRHYMPTAPRACVASVMLYEWYQDAVSDGRIPKMKGDVR